MNPRHLKDLIARVLAKMSLFSTQALDLLLLTAAQESNLKYLKQLGNGPARGLFQMEPDTLADILKNFLAYRPDLFGLVRIFMTRGIPKELDLTGNLLFQIAIARIHYLRVKERIPSRLDFPDDDAGFNEYIMALAQYWKAHWNTDLGAGTAEEAYDNYFKHIHGRV